MNEEVKTFRERVIEALAEQDPNLSANDPAWINSAFLVASMMLGTDTQAIADALEMDPITAGVLAERCRNSGIWTDDGVNSEPWLEAETGGVAFAMDAAILEGHVERVGTDQFRVTARGKKHVEEMLGISTDPRP